MFLDAEMDHRQYEKQSSNEQNPSGDEDVHESKSHDNELANLEGTPCTYGILTASARHTPAAPADCNDLSGKNELSLHHECQETTLTYRIQQSEQACGGRSTWHP